MLCGNLKNDPKCFFCRSPGLFSIIESLCSNRVENTVRAHKGSSLQIISQEVRLETILTGTLVKMFSYLSHFHDVSRIAAPSAKVRQEL